MNLRHYHYSDEFDGTKNERNTKIVVNDYLGKSNIRYKNVDDLCR